MDFAGFTSCQFKLDSGSIDCNRELLCEITSLGFKITRVEPLQVECDKPTISQIHDFTTLVNSKQKIQMVEHERHETIDAHCDSLGFENLSLSHFQKESDPFDIYSSAKEKVIQEHKRNGVPESSKSLSADTKTAVHASFGQERERLIPFDEDQLKFEDIPVPSARLIQNKSPSPSEDNEELLKFEDIPVLSASLIQKKSPSPSEDNLLIKENHSSKQELGVEQSKQPLGPSNDLTSQLQRAFPLVVIVDEQEKLEQDLQNGRSMDAEVSSRMSPEGNNEYTAVNRCTESLGLQESLTKQDKNLQALKLKESLSKEEILLPESRATNMCEKTISVKPSQNADAQLDENSVSDALDRITASEKLKNPLSVESCQRTVSLIAENSQTSSHKLIVAGSKEEAALYENNACSQLTPSMPITAPQFCLRDVKEVGVTCYEGKQGHACEWSKDVSEGFTWEERYSIGGISLTISSGNAMDFDTCLIVSIGNPFQEILSISQLEEGKNLVLSGNPLSKEMCSFWQVSDHEDSQDMPSICSLLWDTNLTTVTGLEEVFGKLSKVLRALAVERIRAFTDDIVITSSILYPSKRKASEKSSSPGKQGRRGTSKMISDFVRHIHGFLRAESSDGTTDLDHVTIVGCEETVPQLIKLFDSLALTDTDVSKVRKDTQDVSDRGIDSTDFQPQDSERDVQGSMDRLDDIELDPELNPTGTRGEKCVICARLWASLRRQPCCSKKLCHHCQQKNNVCPFCLHKAFLRGEQCVTCDRFYPQLSHQPCCNGALCQACSQTFSVCPHCLESRGPICGSQPKGYMHCQLTEKLPLEGQEHCGTYVLVYQFKDGVQASEHPHPGRPYTGTKRVAYLPASDPGVDILYLLRLAFMRRLTFTVGYSTTSGKDDTVVWNGICHKTSPSGGKACFGYPDDSYHMAVTLQLQQMGVTYESITDDERAALKKYFSILHKNKVVRDDDH